MIDEIIIATGNKHKVEEISAILKDLNIKVIPMSELQSFPKTVEDGDTLKTNAEKKAKEAAAFFKKWVIADDTGLEVDYLNGAPSVYSARYAGENCSYDDNNKKLLAALSDVPQEKRTAKFKCVIAVASPEGKTYFAEGEIFGIITNALSGTNGFGYDPVFFVPAQNKTFAELSADIKNKISHRAQALQKAKKIIEAIKN
ncbi:XTP/dITP diphosphatase [Endomicrobium proavitum]|uniref:dITP/XTP pyrophosphatase n=1 Tax=Endomicrobium proavitum TaxID=1408281 RepID=A0A0G3WI35_9BACT|nr:XTP/dITP diphosphatase [Endomicrobium proavitum]AKL97527.1 Non-canonical purine NTP pyrophosphatase [Endomicrobium proavitum]